MRKISYIIFAVVVAGCGGEDEAVDTTNSWLYQQPENGNGTAHNEVFFDGNTILLENIASDNITLGAGEFIVQKIEKTVGDIKLRAQRIPTELFLKNQGVPTEEIASALSDLEQEQLFYFEFEEIQRQDLMKKYFKDNMDQKVSYMSFDIFQDFAVVNAKGDTITANYTVYERNYHIAPFERLLVSFSSVSEDENLKLIYKDQIFGKGTSQFSFASTTYLQNNTKQPS